MRGEACWSSSRGERRLGEGSGSMLGEQQGRLTAQVERAANCPTRGEKYRVGDKVRIKLSVAERGKLGGKKLAPLNSDVYRVQEVHGEGWTYTLSSENGIGRQKNIHFDSLKLFERVISQRESGEGETRAEVVTERTPERGPSGQKRSQPYQLRRSSRPCRERSNSHGISTNDQP